MPARRWRPRLVRRWLEISRTITRPYWHVSYRYLQLTNRGSFVPLLSDFEHGFRNKIIDGKGIKLKNIEQVFNWPLNQREFPDTESPINVAGTSYNQAACWEGMIEVSFGESKSNWKSIIDRSLCLYEGSTTQN